MSLAAQNSKISVSGIVLNDQGEPLPGATILVQETQRGFSTDFDGKFTLKIDPNQDVNLRVTYIGYQTMFKTINFSQDENLEIVLEKGNYILDEVIVSAIRVQADAPVTHSSLNKKRLKSVTLDKIFQS